MHAVDAAVRAEMEWYTCAFSGLTKRDHAAVVMQLLNIFVHQLNLIIAKNVTFDSFS